MKIFEQVFTRSQADSIEIPDRMVVMIGLYRISKDLLGLFQFHEEVMVSIYKKFILTREGDLVAEVPEVTFSTKRWTFKGKRFVSQIKYKIDPTESIYVSGKIARCSDLITKDVFRAFA